MDWAVDKYHIMIEGGEGGIEKLTPSVGRDEP